MRRSAGIALTIICCVVLVNCKQPVIVYQEAEAVSIPIEKPTEVIRMSNDFTVKPVAIYPAYFVQASGRVMGIPADASLPDDFDPVPVVATIEGKDIEKQPDEFFVIGSDIYFQVFHFFPAVYEMDGDAAKLDDDGKPIVIQESEVMSKHYKQSGSAVELVDKDDFPEAPEAVRVEKSVPGYSFYVGDYSGEPISVAVRDSDKAIHHARMASFDPNDEDAKEPTLYEERFFFVDGFFVINGGVLIHAPSGRGEARPDGLLYWPEGKGNMNHWGIPGRFWMM